MSGFTNYLADIRQHAQPTHAHRTYTCDALGVCRGMGCPDCDAPPIEDSRAEAYPLPIMSHAPELEAPLSRGEHLAFWLFITFLTMALVFILSGGMGYLLQRWLT